MAHSCCNPFDLPGHNWNTRQKNLRSVTTWMCERAPISMDSKLSKTTVGGYVESELVSEVSLESDLDTAPYIDSTEAISALNRCLSEIGETPYIKRKTHQRHYPDQKIKKITDAMKRTILTDIDCDDGDEDEIIEQLRKKFEVSTSRSEQLQILTVLPQTWSLKKIQTVFQTSDYGKKIKEACEREGDSVDSKS